LILFSALFSGSETALTAARPIKLEIWVKRRIPGARRTFELVQHPDRFLIATLIGNNLVVVAASSLMALYLDPYLGGFAITAVSALILLFWGEILPKTIASDRATSLAVPAALFIRVFSILVYPVILVTRRIMRGMFHLFGLRPGQVERIFSRKDMAHLLDEGHRTGVVDANDHDLISRLILRSESKLREIMIPRTEMVVAGLKMPIPDLIVLFEKTGYSRMPVIDKGLDDVVGLVTVKDVVIEKPKAVGEILRDVFFVPEFKRVASFLNEMQQRRIGLAIVVDEYGGTAGLVTIEDLVEEFLGDIQDEFDDESNLYREVGLGQIEVKARVDVDELNAQFELGLPSGDYQTLSGLIMANMGRIPKRGERIHVKDCTITILSGTRRNINWVRIVREQES